MTEPGIPVVVDVDWWRAHQSHVVLADVRWYVDGRRGWDAYLSGHLPGAVFVDLDRALAAHPDDPAQGRHPLPSPQHFAEAMAAVGIGDDDTVVAYDDAGGVIAARLVWMLRATGHNAAMLDGGVQAYDGALEQQPVERPPATFTVRPWPADLVATIDDAVDTRYVVIDARDHDRFTGAIEPLDPRAGHIPGARSVPCREHLTADGRLRPVEELRRRFVDAGVVSGAEVVSYCGSGVTACHNLLVLEHAGFASGRLYPGSWSAYSNTEREAATGE